MLKLKSVFKNGLDKHFRIKPAKALFPTPDPWLQELIQKIPNSVLK